MKKTAHVAKLQGELVLLERQITACEQAQGVAIYTVLAKRLQHLQLHDSDAADTDVHIFAGLQAAFVAATEDLKDLNEKRNKLQEELDIREESSTANSKSSVGGFFTNTKLKTELAYYEREIKLRQGIFGHQVVNDLGLLAGEPDKQFDENDDRDGMVATVLNQAKRELLAMMQQKQDKQAEIQAAKDA
eukprot:scaffold189_cov188-Amphora_coffeaeformis.AAC.1